MQGFRGWIEDWEKPLLTTNDSLAEATILAKYKNMRFLNPDDGVCYVIRGRYLIPRGWNGEWECDMATHHMESRGLERAIKTADKVDSALFSHSSRLVAC